MNGIIPAAAYARVSSQRQADEKTIDSQLGDIHRRVAHDQATEPVVFLPDDVFRDEGWSGSELFRPGLEKLRDRIAAGMLQRLYIHSPDRLARKMVHQALLLDEFRKYHCEVVFLNQPDLAESPEANLLIQMQGVIAEYERDKILERTRRGRRYAAAAGKVSVFSRAPYGYRYISKAEGDGQARWEILPQESQQVRWMFEQVDQHGLSLRAIRRALAEQGVGTRKGGAQWDQATIRGILVNPAYYGQARFGKSRLVERKPGKRPKRGDAPIPRQARVAEATSPEEQIAITVPAIIDEGLFHRVGERMSENRRRQRERQSGPKYLLSGLLICGSCNSAYCGRRPNGGKYFYYRCIGTDKHRLPAGQAICDNHSANGVELENVVWSDLCELLRNPHRLRAEWERRREEQRTPREELQRREREVQHLHEQLNRLIDVFAAGLIERSEFERRIVPLRERHQRETAALASLRGELEDTMDLGLAERGLSQLGEEVQSQLATADETLKRQLLKLLIKHIEIHPEEIRIVYKVPQNPFVPSPDNRGFLQQWLLRLRLPQATMTIWPSAKRTMM